jgi:DNA-binding transcriptional regulator YdaS (Cro superfamily)
MKLQNWAEEVRGRGLQLATALGVQPPSVSDWITGKRSVPIERCVAIERATGGEVTRRDLRPDDWQAIWPELADPQQQPEAQQPRAQAATETVAGGV